MNQLTNEEYNNRPILKSYLNILNYENIPEFLKKYLTCPSVLRLKSVGYFCGMDYASKDIYNFKEYVSRFDHSLTVALITWNITKNKKASLAGLFHDVGTPAFSHAIDYMNKDYERQESTEAYTEKIINDDKLLLDYLLHDNINPEEIINFKKYSIVDNDRPKLCADRLDGIILTSLFWTNMFDIDDVKNIINSLKVYNIDNTEEIGFNSLEITKKVLEANKKIDEYCHSTSDIHMMNLLGKITEKGIQNNYFTYEELYKLDEITILNILEKKDDIELKELIKEFKMIKKEDINIINIPNIKKRNINPLVNGIRYNSN